MLQSFRLKISEFDYIDSLEDGEEKELSEWTRDAFLWRYQHEREAQLIIDVSVIPLACCRHVLLNERAALWQAYQDYAFQMQEFSDCAGMVKACQIWNDVRVECMCVLTQLMTLCHNACQHPLCEHATIYEYKQKILHQEIKVPDCREKDYRHVRNILKQHAIARLLHGETYSENSTPVTDADTQHYETTIHTLVQAHCDFLRDRQISFAQKYEEVQRGRILERFTDLDTIGQYEAFIRKVRRKLDEHEQDILRSGGMAFHFDDDDRSQYVEILDAVLDSVTHDAKQHNLCIPDNALEALREQLQSDLQRMESVDVCQTFLRTIRLVYTNEIYTRQVQGRYNPPDYSIDFDRLYAEMHREMS